MLLFSNNTFALRSADASVVFVVAIGAVVVYLVARWASGHRNGSDTDTLQTKPEPDQAVLKESAKDPDYLEPPFGEDKVVIRKFYFATFDTVPGPPDPLNFCDELTIEVYSRDTGGSWTESYTVATPGGIQAHMESHGWDVFFSQQVFSSMTTTWNSSGAQFTITSVTHFYRQMMINVVSRHRLRPASSNNPRHPLTRSCN